MVSSNLTVKSVDRTNLYYGKFEYRIETKSPHMFYSWSCKNIDQYKARIREIREDYDKTRFAYHRPKPNPQEWEYELIENLLNLQVKYTVKKDFTYRREGEICNIYTSNMQIINDIISFYPKAAIFKVDVAPQGIKYFKRTPPAKYRAYMTNNRMSGEFRQEFLEYLERTPDIRPSDAFYTYLKRSNNYHYHSYLWDTYFIDYDDDKNLMMMMLMFPGAIGKKYKLEQK